MKTHLTPSLIPQKLGPHREKKATEKVCLPGKWKQNKKREGSREGKVYILYGHSSLTSNEALLCTGCWYTASMGLRNSCRCQPCSLHHRMAHHLSLLPSPAACHIHLRSNNFVNTIAFIHWSSTASKAHMATLWSRTSHTLSTGPCSAFSKTRFSHEFLMAINCNGNTERIFQTRKIHQPFSCNTTSPVFPKPSLCKATKNLWGNTRIKAMLLQQQEHKETEISCWPQAIPRCFVWLHSDKTTARHSLKHHLRKKANFKVHTFLIRLILFITHEKQLQQQLNTVVPELLQQACDLLHCQLMKSPTMPSLSGSTKQRPAADCPRQRPPSCAPFQGLMQWDSILGWKQSLQDSNLFWPVFSTWVYKVQKISSK